MVTCKDHIVLSGFCVRCEIQMIKDRRREELEKEIDGIKEELKRVQVELEETQNEKEENVRKIEEIEEKMLDKDKLITKEINYLENDLRLVIDKDRIVEERYLQVSQELESVTGELSGTKKKLAEEQERDEGVKKMVFVAKERKQQYGLEIEFLSNKISRSLPAADLDSILCGKCKGMIGSEFFPVN